MDIMAQKLGLDPVDFRIKNFIKREQFPYQSALGWEYDSGDYHTAMQKAVEATNYRALREEQKAKQEAFKRGETRELMGIGVSFFTEIVGAGPSKNCDILGIAMFDSAEIRIHPTGRVIARMGTKSQGQGHETTWAQIIATEIGIPADDIAVEEGNTDTAPYGLGTYGSRSTPVAGAAIAMASRKIKAKAQMIAAFMLEVHEDDLEWDVDRFRVKGNPEAFKTMSQIAWAAYNKVPPGMEPGLEAVSYYDPPNMTYPFGAYICVMDIDVDTGVHKVRRFYALDDCGTRINPMIIEGQVHGGCTEGYAIAMGQEIAYDESGNVKGASLMDFFLPTAVETPHWETDYTVTPSPHHPIGAKGVGESPNVGSVPCFANAVNDAFKFLGSTHISMPHDAYRTWLAAREARAARAEPLRPRETMSASIPRETIAAKLAETGYVADRELSTALWMMDYLKRPLLIEGEAGVGKTEVAKALAVVHGAELIRMQCYEGLDANSALYEWNYQRQLIAIKAREGSGESPEIDRGAHLLRRLSARAAAAGRDPEEGLAGSADRRSRPRRRGVRGLPARAFVRLPDDDPGIRDRERPVDPARRADLERNARTLRRAAPSLPLSLSRFSRRRPRGGDPGAPAGHRRRRSRFRSRAWSLACARRNCARRRASPKRSTGRRRSPASASTISPRSPKSFTRR